MSQPPTGTDLRDWIGREQEQSDTITIAPLVGLSATLDRDDPAPRDGDPLPPFWHWLFFLPNMSTSKLRPDGHAPLGGFMPPVSLPRRMWAGSRLTFAHAPRVGETVRRISRIADVTVKSGSRGQLVFVAVQHEIHTSRGLAIRETQDIVYLEAQTAESAVATEPAADGLLEPLFSRVITPDPVLLFRYSALTFNSHRIHYDRKYAMEVEGYPGLLVHGPLLATLLLDLLRREHPDAVVREFSFRARRPLFDSVPFSVNGRAEDANRIHLWTLDAQGNVAVRALATIA